MKVPDKRGSDRSGSHKFIPIPKNFLAKKTGAGAEGPKKRTPTKKK